MSISLLARSDFPPKTAAVTLEADSDLSALRRSAAAALEIDADKFARYHLVVVQYGEDVAALNELASDTKIASVGVKDRSVLIASAPSDIKPPTSKNKKKEEKKEKAEEEDPDEARFKGMTVENILTKLTAAKDKKTRANVLEYIDMNFSELIKSATFLKAPKAQVAEILKSDTLSCDGEGEVLTAALAWGAAEAKREEKEGKVAAQLEGITELIRFPLLSTNEVAVKVTQSGLLSQTQLLELFSYLGRRDSGGEVKVPESLKAFSIKPREGRASARDMVSLAGCKMTEVRHGTYTQGCITEDTSTGRVYYIENYTQGSAIEEFANFNAYVAQNISRTFSLSTPKKGTYHCAMGGYLYYCGASSGQIIKADLKDGSQVATGNVPSAAGSFSWGGSVDTCCYADNGNKLWVLYQNSSTGQLEAANIDTKTMQAKKTYPLSFSMSSKGYAFLVAGFIYFGQNYASPTLQGRLNLAKGTYDDSYSNALQRASYLNGACWCPKSDRLWCHDSQVSHIYEKVSRGGS